MASLEEDRGLSWILEQTAIAVGIGPWQPRSWRPSGPRHRPHPLSFAERRWLSICGPLPERPEGLEALASEADLRQRVIGMRPQPDELRVPCDRFGDLAPGLEQAS